MENCKILVVVDTDLSDDNSASLCHTAYIRGLVDSNNYVTVICVTPSANRYDFKVDGAKYLFISDENWLVKRAREKRKNDSPKQTEVKKSSSKRNFKKTFKYEIRQIFIKAFGATTTWKKRVLDLKFDDGFDVLLSLSSPPTSHIVAGEMMKKGKINIKKWCQIWEDPWSTDLYNVDQSIAKKENRILSSAQKVLYVTPLTLERQKKLFPLNANKMGWLPLPTYYEELSETKSHSDLRYGYFGQYYPNVRNLQPAYEALNCMKKDFTICGEPHGLFAKTETTHIYPRITPEELKKIEQETDVLVFVCNLGGGQIPGKIYQYSGTQKWILFILDGNEYEINVIRDYFKKFNRYVFCNNNRDDIIRAINTIESGSVNGVENARVAFFSADNIAREIIQYSYEN